MRLPPVVASVLAPYRQLLRLVAARFSEDRCVQVAASLSFTTLLSLVPLITVALALLSRLPQFALAESALRDFLFHNLLPDKAGRVVGTYALQFSEKTHRLTLLGSVGIFATALMTMLTMDHTFNAIWRVHRPRPLKRRILLYAGALLFGPLLAAVVMAAVTFFVSTSLGWINEPEWVRRILFKVLPVLFQTGMLASIYWAVPNCVVKRRDAVLGGLLASVLFALVQQPFASVISNISAYRLVYGAFAALPIFLMWLHLSWTVVLVGALVAAVLPEWRRGYAKSHGPSAAVFAGNPTEVFAPSHRQRTPPGPSATPSP